MDDLIIRNDVEIGNLQGLMASLERNLATWKRRKNELEKTRTETMSRRNTALRYHAEFKTSIHEEWISKHLQDSLRRKARDLAAQIDNIDTDLRIGNGEIAVLERRILEMVDQIEALERSAIHLVWADVNAAMSGNPAYVPDSLQWNTSHIWFELDGISLHPSRRSCTSFTEDIPTIPVPACIVRIALNGFDTQILPREEGALGMYSPNDESVHPHILNRGRPCWGDFGGPFMECMANHNIAAAMEVVVVFLETADPDDWAGRHWAKLATVMFHKDVRHYLHADDIIDTDSEHYIQPWMEENDEGEEYEVEADPDDQPRITEFYMRCLHPDRSSQQPIIIDSDNRKWAYMFDCDTWYDCSAPELPDFKELHMARERVARLNRLRNKIQVSRKIRDLLGTQPSTGYRAWAARTLEPATREAA